MIEDDQEFHRLLQGWMRSAAAEFGYRDPAADTYAGVLARVPAGVRALVVAGHASGLIVPVGGHHFTFLGLPAGKGPLRLGRPFLRCRRARGALGVSRSGG